MRKETVILALNSLDEEFNAEELIEKLLLIEKVEKDLKDVEEGKVHAFEEIKEQFQNKWSK
jgi:hypothetical protein